MTEPQRRTRTSGRAKGPRPKHVPQRTCVVCREKGDKRGLIRIVRTTDQHVELDPTGKKNGRGAYLCHRQVCWHKALEGSFLDRALNTALTDETRVELKKHAASLDDGVSSGNAAQLK